LSRSRRRGDAAAIAIAVVILSISGGLGSAEASELPAHPAGTSGSAAFPADPSELAQILAQPWADRAGYDPSLAADVQAVAPLSNGSVEVVLTLQPSSPAFFSTAGGPRMTSSEIANVYGDSSASYQAMIQYFTGEGLSVLHTWPNRLFLSLDGPASAVGAAFGTTLDAGLSSGKLVHFPTSAPSLPPALESQVAAVSGLSEGFTAFTVPLAPASLPAPAQGRTTTTVTPSAVHLLYGLDGLYNYSGGTHWATGIGIATVLWGEGYDPSDLQTFFSNYYPGGFPSITIQAYPVDGALSPGPNAVNDPSNVTSEMTLDIEWAGSAAPGATIDAVYAPDGPASDSYSPSDTSLEDALNTASQIPGVDVISMSFGSPDGQDLSFQTAYETALKAATLSGQTILAASGDNAGVSGSACTGTVTPEYPAASQWVVAVGGTAPVVSLSALGTVTGIDSEPAWNRSGGGYSVTYPNPSWQLTGTSGGPTAAGHRGIPDVAGPAQDNIFYYKGTEAAGAGTSFAAPLWAGIVAEMDAIRGAPLGWITPRLYSVGIEETEGTAAIGLSDITSGGNCLGPATAGWDTSTGWGSPRANFLYPDLDETFVNVTLQTSTSSVVPGGSFVTVATITNASDHAPLADLNVSISVDSPGYVGPCGGPYVNVPLTTNVTGAVSASASVPGCYLGSSVVVTATVSGKYYGFSSATVHVNLVGLAKFLQIVQVFPYNVITFALLVTIVAVAGWRIGEWNHRRRIAKARRDAPPPIARPAVPVVAPKPRPAPAQVVPAVPVAPTVAASTVAATPVVPPVAPSEPTVLVPEPAPATPDVPTTVPTEPSVDAADGAEEEVPATDATAGPIEVPDHVAGDSEWAPPPPIDPAELPASEVPDHVTTAPSRPPMPLCPSCGAALPGDSTTCPACGAALPGP
jgi:kumamolisin